LAGIEESIGGRYMTRSENKATDSTLAPAAPMTLGQRAQLEKYLRDRPSGDGSAAIQSRHATGRVPLSYAQQQVWLHSQLAPDLPVYHETMTIRRRGALDAGVLERAFNEILRRHEAWRITVDVVDGEPVQVAHPEFRVSLPVRDFTDLPIGKREVASLRLATEEARRPFNLKKGPLFRALLCRLGSEDYRIYLTFHHIIFDGVSGYRIFWRELKILYAAFLAGLPSPLREPGLQYTDFAIWQRQWIAEGGIASQMQYWRERLRERPAPLELSPATSRVPLETFRGALHRVQFSASLSEEIAALSRREGATPFMTLLAAFQVLLQRYTSRDEFTVGTINSGRSRSELENVFGCFQNPVVLRASLAGNPSFRELLRRCRESTLEAISNGDVPFESLVRGLRVPHDASRNPLFQVLFTVVPALPEDDSGWHITQLDVETGTSKFDLYLELDEQVSGITGRFIYSTDLFNGATIARMAGHLETLLTGVIENPDAPVSDLPLLTHAERRELLVQWNDTRREYPREQTVHGIFEEQAARQPNSVALLYRETQLTYGELDQRANQFAHRLHDLGVVRGDLVGISLERHTDLVAALLGVLKAGAAYLPLDSELPPERLALLIRESHAKVVVTQSSLQRRLPPELKLISVDENAASLEACSRDRFDTGTGPSDLAYVMYTSGSTGTPKGVEVCHRSIVCLLFSVNYAQLGPEETFLQLAPLAFDASTFEIWGPLLHGGRCALFPERMATITGLGDALRNNKVSTLWLTSSLFNSVIDHNPRALREVKQLLIGGEALSAAHVRYAVEALPETRIINGYGPTEATTFTCCYRIPPLNVANATSIPIGRPISNTRVYILDRHRQPVPVGISGELYIGGDGLARGYLNDPRLTAERFLPDPFSDNPSDRLYRSGDICRYRADGNIEFLGRADDQVKIRGHRIEPGEVEAALKMLPSIRNAAVVVREDPSGDKRLVAYWVPAAAMDDGADLIRTALRRLLPEYMIPAVFMKLEVMPLTANGKVDRHRLPVPEAHEQELVRGFKRPKGDVESRLLRIWESVLGRGAISVDDDFFDMGGHSLLAVRLMDRIEREMGRRLPLSALFQAPTVERMAALLMKEGPRSSWECLIPIEPRGSRPPLFCIHGVGGTLLRLGELARLLGDDQPVYGLEARGLDGKNRPLDRIEEMAALYIREMRSLQPEGPYYLCGLSFGGVVAFEMAQQLLAQGQKVGVLALFDTFPGQVETRVALFRKFLGFSSNDKIHYAWGKGARIVRRIRRLPQNLRLPKPLKDVKRACHFAALRYVPHAYAAPVTLFRARERALRGFDDPKAGWEEWARGGLEIHSVAGDHLSIVAYPNVQFLAQALRECLERAQAADPNWQQAIQARSGKKMELPISGAGTLSVGANGTASAEAGNSSGTTLGVWPADSKVLSGSVGQSEAISQGANLSYWRSRFGDLPNPVDLPTDRARATTEGFREGVFKWQISSDLVKQLTRLCGDAGSLGKQAWLAGFAALLFRHSGQPDIPLIYAGDSSAQRGIACQAADSIGAECLRIEVDGGASFEQLLHSVATEVGEAEAHSGMPPKAWMEALYPGRDLYREGVFRAGLVFGGGGNSGQSGIPACAGTELQLYLDVNPKGGTAMFVYHAGLWDEETIARMADHYGEMLSAATKNPAVATNVLSMLPSAELAQISRWNTTPASVPDDTCIHELFEAQAARTPDGIAAIYKDQLLTFREINESANRLGRVLQRRGVGTGAPVAICLESSPGLIISLLAVLKAGGACLPLDPKYPDSRLSHMLEDSGAGLLISREEAIAGLEMANMEKIMVGPVLWDQIANEDPGNLSAPVRPDDIAYVIYTSGSTGKPKGVLLTHRGYVNHERVAIALYGLTAGDRVPQLSSISFDISVEEMFPTWAAGGAVVLRTDDVSLDIKSLVEWSNAQGITIWNLPTALWHELVNEMAESNLALPTSLRLVIVGGEKATARALNQWCKLAGKDIRWINTYGPTETSVVASAYEADFSLAIPAELPIGRPLPNFRMYILDALGQPVPAGVFGELYIGGVGVACGYGNRPELTEEKFLRDPFAGAPAGRMYRTGDIVRWLADGNVEFKGRADDQVKIQGFRVEPGEVEGVLGQHDGLRAVAVVARQVASGEKRLIAFYVPLEPPGPSPADLRIYLRDKLPEYMLPAGFVRLERMPLTPNGKVDRRGLPAIESTELTVEEGYIAPRNDIEARLAEIWESVLAVRPVGIQQSFFDLGGYSLLAVRLMHRIERSFGKRLPITALLHAPTVETLAKLLEADGGTPAWSSLVPIQTGGTKPPLFLVHGVGGGVMTFRELAQCLSPEQPLYGLQALGLDGKRKPLERVEDMAAHYIQEIRSVQSKGPYFLGGLSFGGMVALEMAEQLERQGEEVALLALFDTFPGREQSRAELLAKLARMPARDRAQYVARRMIKVWRKSGMRLYRYFLPAAIKDVQRACHRASRSYDPPVWHGKVTLFRPTEKSLRGVDDETAGWGAWARGGVGVFQVPGGHITMLRQPNVRILAGFLKKCLLQAQQGELPVFGG
jgi:aspartate racemase